MHSTRVKHSLSDIFIDDIPRESAKVNFSGKNSEEGFLRKSVIRIRKEGKLIYIKTTMRRRQLPLKMKQKVKLHETNTTSTKSNEKSRPIKQVQRLTRNQE